MKTHVLIALAKPMPTAKRTDPMDSNAAVTLTDNQRQILLQLFAGSHIDEIASATGRKPSTIFNTVRTVRKQLGARNDFDLMRECLRRRIVTLGEVYRLADALRRAQRPSASGRAGR